MMPDFQAIGALVLRYLFLYTRNPVRVIEILFWPLMELLVWGYLSLHLKSQVQDTSIFAASYLIGAIILWEVLFRAQQGVAISFLEDVWTRNLLNIFVAPIRTGEYIAATFLIGLLRIAATVLILSALAFPLYHYNLLELRLALLPFFANLLFFGWSLGIISVSLIVRWGQAAESLAWAVPFMIQPLACVFYPVSELPDWLEPVALAIPASHVFEGMRAVMNEGPFPWHHMGMALMLNAAFFAAAAATFAWILRYARNRGLLTRVVSH